MVVRISGAFFFAATARIGGTLDRIGSHPRVLVFDFTDVPIIDSTGTRMLFGFVRKLQRAGTEVYFAGVRRSVRRALLNAGLRRPLVRYADSVESVRNMAKTAGAEDTAAGAPSPLPEAH
jgi:SulP family sulfate permease